MDLLHGSKKKCSVVRYHSILVFDRWKDLFYCWLVWRRVEPTSQLINFFRERNRRLETPRMVWVHISYILYMAIGGLRFRLKFTSLGALVRQALLVRTCADSILFGWSNIHRKKKGDNNKA